LANILIGATALLAVRVLFTIILEYRFYFPPDFDQAFFFAGRKETFTRWLLSSYYLWPDRNP